MSNTTTVDLSISDDVATVRFAGEKGVSVFSSAVVDQLGEQVEKLAEDAAVRFVVFRGTGKTFVAGADIKEMSGLDEPGGRDFSRKGHRVFDEIERLGAVTFAAVNGHAMGGGCELALACDFRLMVAGARIGQPECRLGLIPGWGGTLRLPRAVGRTRALWLMLSGEAITAEEALKIGLADEVVADEEALDASLQVWFTQLREASPAAVAQIKQALLDGHETQHFGRCFAAKDGREGMRAFLEKRKPAWAK